MAYPHALNVWQSPNDATDDLIETVGDAAAAHIFNVMRPITVVRVGVLITEVVATSSTDGIISFDRRVLTDSDTGRGDADVGQVTIPDTTAVGKTVVDAGTPVDLDPGDQVVPQVTTAGVDAGTETGEFLYFIEYYIRPESDVNLTDVVVSA